MHNTIHEQTVAFPGMAPLSPMPDEPPPVSLSEAAARKIRELIAEEGNPALVLRVYISGGGCSGFQYGFSFDEAAQEDDEVIESGGVRMVIDPISLQYLQGAGVDYRESLSGAQFMVSANPNAKTTCGCGSSFSM